MKKTSCVIPAADGDAFWQPSVKGDCITIKISPWNIDKTQHTVFLHELPKGGYVAEHAHDANEEIFICLEGEGIITIDGVDNQFKKHDVAFVAPLSRHKITCTSEMPLKMMIVISPTGLEERLKLMGIERKQVSEEAPEAFYSAIGKQKTHGVR